jgi:hypothetical protein
MRRFIIYCNSILLGVILGMIFVALAHSCPQHLQKKVYPSAITVSFGPTPARGN